MPGLPTDICDKILTFVNKPLPVSTKFVKVQVANHCQQPQGDGKQFATNLNGAAWLSQREFRHYLIFESEFELTGWRQDKARVVVADIAPQRHICTDGVQLDRLKDIDQSGDKSTMKLFYQTKV